MTSQYVVFNYEEEPDEESGFWHVFVLDDEPSNVEFGGPTLMTIRAPKSDDALGGMVFSIVMAINSAVAAAKRYEELEP